MLRPWSIVFLLGACLPACGTPTPNDLVRIDLPGAERYALSTEDGLLAIAGDDLAVDEVPVQYWYRTSQVFDEARVERRGEDLVRLRPKSAQFQFSEFAADGPAPGEELFIQVLEDDPEHRPRLIEVELYRGGLYGDLLEVDDWFESPVELARDFAGAGVYAERKGRYVLVGLLAGLVSSNPETHWWYRMVGDDELLPFVGLDAIAAVLPENSSFFERRVRVFRPDFEHGLNRDGSERSTR